MTAKDQSFEMFQGDTVKIFVTIYDDDNNVKDISGGTINWVMYKRTTSNIVLTKTTTSGIVVLDAANGSIRIDLSPDDTKNLLGYYNHEGEFTDSSGNISTFMIGVVTIQKSLA